MRLDHQGASIRDLLGRQSLHRSVLGLRLELIGTESRVGFLGLSEDAGHLRLPHLIGESLEGICSS